MAATGTRDTAGATPDIWDIRLEGTTKKYSILLPNEGKNASSSKLQTAGEIMLGLEC
jgi:hypothetical protein